MEAVSKAWETITSSANDFLSKREPWQIFVIACGSTVITIKLKNFLFTDEDWSKRVKKTAFNLVRYIPSVRKKIDDELAAAKIEINKAVTGGSADMSYVTKLPTQGMTFDEVVKKMTEYQNRGDVKIWKDGWVSGCVYNGEENLVKLGTKVYEMFTWSNPLHPDVFPDVRQMEAEIVRMCCNMFNGGPETCGTTTSGGTESLLLACLAYRNLAYSRGISNPEIVTSINIHAAIDKAASLFKIRLRKVPLDPKTMTVDIRALKRAISRDTCMLACSAPDFPYGQIDPITQIAELGEKYNIPVHVDACLGGFLISFMDKAGFPLEPFDFRVPGVTSISCDTHKYGFAGKGTSVILYRDSSYRKHQFSCAPEWRGGIYATATLAGSRGGAIIAICWATMMHMGEASYVKSTQDIITTARYIRTRLSEVPEVYVIGDPKVSVIAIKSDTLNVFQMSTYLRQKGWHLTTLQKPAGMHIMVTLRHTKEGVADRLINDMKLCVEYVKLNPKAPCEDAAKIYGMAEEVPDSSLISDVASMYLDALYSTENV